MKNRLLAAMALSCAASMSAWAGNWEKPTVSFVTPDLTKPTVEIPTTGYKYVRGLGDYYLYHLATGMFLTAGNSYGTTMSLGTTGQLISLAYGHDRILYNADSYPFQGWLLTMPNATSNSADGGLYHELYISSQYNGYVDGVSGHMLWSILPQADGTYRISVIEEDTSFGPGGSENIPAESYMGRNPETEDDNTTVVIPLATPGNMALAEVNWKFVSVEDYEAYQARFPLYEMLNTAEAEGMTGLDSYAAVYNNADATVEELENAAQDLKVAYGEFVMSRATAENPVDVTGSYLADAEGTALTGWTIEGKTRVNSGEHWSDTSVGYLDTDYWGDTSWSTSAKQTLSLPNGMYTLVAIGRANENAILTLVAGDNKITFPSIGSAGGTVATDGTICTSIEDGINEGHSFANGNAGRGWNQASVDFVINDNEIEVGVEISGHAQYSWASVGNFKLLYKGALNTEYVRTQLTAALETANAYKSEVDASRAFYSIAGGEAFDEDVVAAQEMLNNSSATETEILEMITKLNARVDAFKYDVEVYGKKDEKLAELDAMVENIPSDVDLESFWDYYDSLYDAFNDQTFDPNDFDGITAKAEALYKADFMKAVQDGLMDDITPLITNPKFANGATGWLGTGFTASNNGICIEQFNKEYDSYQIIEGLPQGTYEVSVRGFYRPGDYANCATNYGVEGDTYNAIRAYLYGNDTMEPLHHMFDDLYDETADGFVSIAAPAATEVDGKFAPNTYTAAGVALNDGRYSGVTAKCTVGEDGVLRFGVKTSGTRNGNDWSAFTDFQIRYLGADDMSGYVAALENVLNAAEEAYNTADVTVTEDANTLRSLKASIEIAMSGYTTPQQFADASAQLREATALVQEGTELIKTINAQAIEILEANDNGLYADYDTDLAWELADCAEEITFAYDDKLFETLDEVKEMQKRMNEAYTAMIMGNVNGSASAPADVTDLLKTPSFDDATGAASAAGWTYVTDGGNANLCNVSNDDKTYHLFEMYDNTSFDINQKVYALKAGWYYVDVQGFYRAGSTDVSSQARYEGNEPRNVQLYVTTSEGKTSDRDICSIFEGVVKCLSIDPVPGYYSDDKMIPTQYLLDGDATDVMNYIPYSVTGSAVRFDVLDAYHTRLAFEVKEGTEYVQIGLKKEDRQELTVDWSIFDNFKLYYTGSEQPTVSVEGVEAATADVVKSVYYTIGGIRISKPAQSGLYIREDLLSDGSKKVTKIMVK